MEGPHGGTENLQLVDRLIRTDVAKRRRSVGCERNERDVRQIRLDDGRMQVRCGRARGREHDSGNAAHLAEPEREEARRALIDAHMQDDLPAGLRLGECDRERSRTGSGGHDDI